VIRAEVEEDDRVSVLDGRDRPAVAARDDDGLDELVRHAAPERLFNCFDRIGRALALAVD
jgi:hypothetical protein